MQHICQDVGRASEENRQVVRALLASHGCFGTLARCCQGRGRKDVTWLTFVQILEGNGHGMPRKLYKLIPSIRYHETDPLTCGFAKPAGWKLTQTFMIIHAHSSLGKCLSRVFLSKKKGLRVVDAWCRRRVCILVSSS